MDTTRFSLRHLLSAALVMFLICGFASMPIAAAESVDSSTNTFCIDFHDGSGYGQSLWFDGLRIVDCDGNQFISILPTRLFETSGARIDLSHSGLNRDKPFKEVQLHLTLKRDWGFSNCYTRLDDFILNVTYQVTKEKYKPYTIVLKASNSYRAGKADAVTICDRLGNMLIHFPATHDDGSYGDYGFADTLRIQWVIDGCCNYLFFKWVCITDCDGNQVTWNDPLPRDEYSYAEYYNRPQIDLSRSGLNLDKPFKEVKLHLTLKRDWGFSCCYQRWDDFTLDVTDLVTKNETEPYLVRLKASNSYQVGKADAVTIFDCLGNKLIHFPSTHDDGHFSS